MTLDTFDVVIIGDFRFPGGTSTAIAAEIRALRLGGHTVGLYQMNAPVLQSLVEWNSRITAFIDSGEIRVIAPGGLARCALLFIHSPWIFAEPQADRPRIEAGLRLMVAHHAPVDARGDLCYDPVVIERHAAQALGGPIVWAPISRVCREAFDVAGMTQARLAFDWTNVVFVDDWGHARAGLIGDRPVIGRHGRPQLEKWPASRAAVLTVYPDRQDLDVCLLGVGCALRQMVGPFPDNWRAWAFNEIAVKDFLQGIDFFVYFHHPDLLETFGLTIAEAAASGCVAIVPPYLEKTFGEAALYCAAEDAVDLVRAIAADPGRFAALSARGREAIRTRFGPEDYLARLRRLLTAADAAVFAGVVSDRCRGPGMILRATRKRLRHRLRAPWRALKDHKTVRRTRRKVGKLLRSR